MSHFINIVLLLHHLLHGLEERLAIVLECHDELQLRASRFHCYRENKSGAKHSSQENNLSFLTINHLR